MNKLASKSGFFISLTVAIGGEVQQQLMGWHGGGFYTSMIGAIFVLAFGRILVLDRILPRRIIKLGSETLPAIKDVASVVVHEQPISDDKKMALLRAIAKAQRASSCGSISRQIPISNC